MDDTHEGLRKYLLEYRRKVKFGPEEMATILDDAVWLMLLRYRDTEPVPMEEWLARIGTELMVSKDRKAFQEHGVPDLVKVYGLEETDEPPA